MLDENSIKLVATLSMFILTLLCCYAPVVVSKKWRKSKNLIGVLNCLAGGVVLGALLLHMVPEMLCEHDHAQGHDHSHVQKDEHKYPLGPLCSGISFLFLFAIDRLFLSHAHCENESEGKTAEKSEDSKAKLLHDEHGHEHDDPDHSTIDVEKPHEDCHEADVLGGCHMEGISNSKNKSQAYAFILALSLHSVLEGLGMASKNSPASLRSFIIGLFAHKWLEAFALGVTVRAANLSNLHTFGLIMFYSVLTPVGILGGIAWNNRNTSSQSTSIILNGLAAGSFLFVSCIEMIPPEFHRKEKTTFIKFLALCLGFVIMALVALTH